MSLSSLPHQRRLNTFLDLRSAHLRIGSPSYVKMANNSFTGLPGSTTRTTPSANRATCPRPDHRLKVCNTCKKTGHIAKDCRARECWTCGSYEHLQRDCPQQVGVLQTPPSHQQPRRRPVQPVRGQFRQAYQPRRPPIRAAEQVPAPEPAQAQTTSGTLARCEGCRSIFHTKGDCPRAKYNFSDANERAIDELPSIPVTLKPTKTAAALETERKYAEKLARGEQKGVEKAEGEGEDGEAGYVSKVNEPGDLIEF